MLNFGPTRQLLKRFQNNEDGNIALTFAASAVVVIGCMGAAMDFSTLSNANSRSQSIADQLALSAAIFVKNNDRPPKSSDEGVTEGQHSAEDLGYEFKGFVEGGAANIDVNVVYDDNLKEARVSVSGKTVPTFIQVLGKQDMSFTAEAVVSYLEVDEAHPASLVLVLDNSGSMRWDSDKMLSGGVRPSNPTSRMAGLKTSVTTFRNELQGRIGDQIEVDGQRILRSGILPYSTAVLPLPGDAERAMDWGFTGISDSFISPMVASGGTNSNPPMAVAKTWLENEDDKHRTEANDNGATYRQPLKFVVFMTDGQNTTGNLTLIADSSTGRYYKKFGSTWYYTTSARYASRNGFVEGRLKLDSDEKTVESCQAMQAEGTIIYTIGYALDVGSYYDPLIPNNPGVVSEATRSTAYSLLTSCASKPEFFIQASDGKELEGAFDQIQNSIVKELIRIKS